MDVHFLKVLYKMRLKFTFQKNPKINILLI